jgi:hypothetical protein
MKKLLNVTLASLVLASLTACMVVPPYGAYAQPGITVVVPAPYYYGSSFRHHHDRDGWGRRW